MLFFLYNINKSPKTIVILKTNETQYSHNTYEYNIHVYKLRLTFIKGCCFTSNLLSSSTVVLFSTTVFYIHTITLIIYIFYKYYKD